MTSPDQERWQAEAGHIIMAAITSRRQMTYNQLAAAAGLAGRNRIHRLTTWLEQIMTEDHRCGRPFRAAVVISKARDGLPAPGFFSYAEQLGVHLDTPDRRTAYQAYLRHLYDTLG